jgi:hypothetical protein
MRESIPRDPDVRVTLSAAARRLSDLPDSTDPSETPDSPARDLEPSPSDSRAAAAPPPLAAYRESARAKPGERLSIRA